MHIFTIFKVKFKHLQIKPYKTDQVKCLSERAKETTGLQGNIPTTGIMLSYTFQQEGGW